MKKFIIFIVILLGFTTIAEAQLVKNPSRVLFVVSLDHDQVTSYEMDIKRVSDNVVIQVINLGKPVPDAQGNVSVNINVQPVTFGTYYVTLRALAGEISSDDSEKSNDWERAPGKPTKPLLQ